VVERLVYTYLQALFVCFRRFAALPS